MEHKIKTTSLLGQKSEAFKRLPKGSRHDQLWGLCLTAINAGYTDEDSLTKYITGIYEQCDGGADYADISATVPRALSNAGKSASATRPVGRVGRPAKISREVLEKWQKWMDGVMAYTQPVFTVASAVGECQKCIDQDYRGARRIEALKAILGGDDFADYYWFGGLRDGGTANFRRNLKNLELCLDCEKEELFCPNPLSTTERKKARCVRIDYMLLEIDEPLQPIAAPEKSEEWLEAMFDQQSRFWSYVIKNKLLPIRSIVYSGGKSLHALVPIAGGDPALIDADNKASDLRSELRRLYRLLHFDVADIDAVRKTRVPWGCRYIGDNWTMFQSLEYIDTTAQPITLEEFKNRLGKIAGEFDDGDGKKQRRCFCEKTFVAYLADKGAEVWTDDIKRKPDCAGWRLDDLNNIPSEVIDDWREMYETEVGADKVKLYLNRELAKNHRNPVLDWIHEKPWDGQDRVDTAINCLGHITPLERTLAKKWLAGAVAILHNGEDGTTFGTEGVLTLVGAQGIGKTSWFNLLFPNGRKWFKDGAAIDVENKDSLLQLTQFWCIELGEVDDTTRKDQSRLKAVITADGDYLRQPYREYAESTDRHCAICASVNREDYLRDETGNRRWWTVMLADRVDRRTMEALDIQQLWAQLEHLWQTATDRNALFRLNDTEREELEAINKECVQDAGYEEVIVRRLHIPTDNSATATKDMTLDEIIDAIWTANWRATKKERNEIAKSLRHLGISCKRTKKSRMWQIPYSTF